MNTYFGGWYLLFCLDFEITGHYALKTKGESIDSIPPWQLSGQFIACIHDNSRVLVHNSKAEQWHDHRLNTSVVQKLARIIPLPRRLKANHNILKPEW